eukprot:3522716-Alexandrium_andersonii.AAC.1
MPRSNALIQARCGHHGESRAPAGSGSRSDRFARRLAARVEISTEDRMAGIDLPDGLLATGP